MISPATRLLWMAALGLAPLLCVAGLVAQARVSCLWAVGLACAVAGWDAWRGSVLGRALTVSSSESDCKWFKGRAAQLSLRVSAPCELALDLPGGLSVEQPLSAAGGAAVLECMPEARGRHRIQRCFVRMQSPWGFWRVDAAKALDIAVRVFPNLNEEPGAAVLIRQKRMGPRAQRPAGRGREFERLREYAAGDNYDEIYWKATARKGAPIVKVFQIERTQDIYVVLDTSIRSGPAERMDRFVRGALMVALATEAEGDQFGLVIFDRQVTRFVPADRGKAHFGRCRDAIFDVKTKLVAPDFGEVFSFLQLRVRRRALLLFITDLEDPIAAEAFVSAGRMLTGKHLVVVASVADDRARPLFSAPDVESVRDVQERLAGHLAWASLQETRNKLRRIGVITRSLRRESIGMDLVAEYADIKRRQAL